MGASAVGGVFTAVTSQWLAYMHEMLDNVAGLRLPVVMSAANRVPRHPPSSTPIKGTRCASVTRDGFSSIQRASRRNITIQYVRLSEERQVRLPSAINFGGLVLSHNKERVRLLDNDLVK